MVLVTNLRDFVLIGEDESGRPVKLETLRLVVSAGEFRAKLERPRAFQRESGKRQNVPRGRRAYSAAELADMLIGRKNITFRAPTGWLPHMVHTVFPQLVFLPPLYRSLAEHLLRVTALAVIGMAAYCLPWLLGFTGVIEPGGVLFSRRARLRLIAALAAALATLRLNPANAAGRGRSKSSRVSLLMLLLPLPLIAPAIVLKPEASGTKDSCAFYSFAGIMRIRSCRGGCKWKPESSAAGRSNGSLCRARRASIVRWRKFRCRQDRQSG